MNVRLRLFVLLLVSTALLPVTGRTQLPAQGGGPAPTAAAPPVVVPDTVDIVVSAPDSLPQPVAVHVVQDTLEFGGLLDLVVDYGPDQVDGPRLKLQASGDWLVPYTPPRPGFFARLLGHQASPTVDTTGLPAPAGLRVIRSFRVYRRDPLRIQWQDQLSPVLTVVGQTTGADQTAAIRDPQDLGWSPWRLVLLILLLMGLGGLLRWLWRRRRRLEPLADWPVPAPAWLALAVGLQRLLADGSLARGDSRLFLDQLVGLVRGYVAGRYRVPAREMTGREIMAACAALGHEARPVAGFAQMIDHLDRERYNPAPPEPAFCREQAVQLLGRVNRLRLDTSLVTIAPDELLAAEKAWAALAAELGLGAGRIPTSVGEEVR